MLLPLFALTTLPLLNAILNSLSAVLISSGYVAIRCRREPVHKACMLAACVTSALFLISYLTYHYHIGSKPFPGQGGIRLVYFAILLLMMRRKLSSWWRMHPNHFPGPMDRAMPTIW